jgi:hypothetical protein
VEIQSAADFRREHGSEDLPVKGSMDGALSMMGTMRLS